MIKTSGIVRMTASSAACTPRSDGNALADLIAFEKLATLSAASSRLTPRPLGCGLGKLAPDDLLFANLEGRPLRPSAVSSDWGDLAERICMPEITFHGLRHSHASQLIAAGVDIVTISKRLGHAKPSVTLAIYAHMFTAMTARPRQPSTRPRSASGGNRVAMFAFVLCAAHAKPLKIKVRRRGRVAEGGGLLNRYTGHTVSGVRIPPSPPNGSIFQ
jgi:hypothetical protein